MSTGWTVEERKHYKSRSSLLRKKPEKYRTVHSPAGAVWSTTPNRSKSPYSTLKSYSSSLFKHLTSQPLPSSNLNSLFKEKLSIIEPNTPLFDKYKKRDFILCEMISKRKLTEKSFDLTDKQLELLKSVLKKPSTEMIGIFDGFEVFVRDIVSLQGSNWLNDNVINYFAHKYGKRLEANNIPCKVFSSFFYSKLKDRGYVSCRTYTRKYNLFEKHLVLIPIHLGNHWCMNIIDFRTKQFRYYDALLGTNKTCTDLLFDFLCQDAKDKNREFDSNGWQFLFPKNIPRQMNGYDCGVFALMYADSESTNRTFNFNQNDIPKIRKKMSYEMLSGVLLE